MSATATVQLEPRTCRGRRCDASIVLVPTLSGSTMALEADLSPKGNVWVEALTGQPTAHVLTTDAVKAMRAAGIPLYLSHHATCVDVAEFKRGGRG